MTRSLVPYDAPILKSFATASFQKSIPMWRARLMEQALTVGGGRCAYDRGWLHLSIDRPAKPVEGWQTKVYVCVARRDYWSFLERLIPEARKQGLRGKVCLPSKSGYERPDKIVFYVAPADLKRTIKILRALATGCAFTSFHHAAATHELGLEPANKKGIYIGCDPMFLDDAGVSWRMYRCFAVAWASINEAYFETLPGGKTTWFERMNLSLTHEGPITLSPNPKHRAFMRKHWKLIQGLD